MRARLTGITQALLAVCSYNTMRATLVDLSRSPPSFLARAFEDRDDDSWLIVLGPVKQRIVTHLTFDATMVAARTPWINMFLQNLCNDVGMQLMPAPRGKKPRSVATCV